MQHSDHGTGDRPATRTAPLDYEPPGIEAVLTADEVQRESLYAGIVSTPP